MNFLLLTVGLVQMTLVLLVAGLIARWLRPRAPESAANVGLVGLLLSLVLLSLAVFDVSL